jgi:hypothetical protein
MRVLLALVILCTGAARAEEAAWSAYVQGDFLEAASLAEPRNGALAARALIAEAVTGAQGDIDALIARAEQNARAALARGGDADARIQLALALGLKGRRASLREAIRGGYAREGRALIDAALAQAPREAWAHALDGAWHLEVVRRGGPVGARFYGASVADGVAAYERARVLAPDDAAIAYQFAVALLEVDPGRYATRAAALLAEAGRCGAGDAFEAALRSEARRTDAVLRAQGAKAAVAAATQRFRR